MRTLAPPSTDPAFLLALLTGCFLLATPACELVGSDSGSDTAARTLPDALDVRRVQFDAARYTIESPDTVNVAAYVAELKICPEGCNCYLPDGIEIAETPDPEEGASRLVFVGSPRQFATGRRYLMSLAVTPSSTPTRQENMLDLLGYRRLE